MKTLLIVFLAIILGGLIGVVVFGDHSHQNEKSYSMSEDNKLETYVIPQSENRKVINFETEVENNVDEVKLRETSSGYFDTENNRLYYEHEAQKIGDSRVLINNEDIGILQ